MAITGINNSSYTSYYASNYKNTVKKTDSEKDSTNTKDGNVTTSTVELKTSRPGVTKTEQIKTGYSNVNDYSKYLQGKYHYVNTGTTSMQGVPTTVSVSSAFLQKCMNDPEKAKYLEENLAAIPDCAKSAVNGCLGTLTKPQFKALIYFFGLAKVLFVEPRSMIHTTLKLSMRVASRAVCLRWQKGINSVVNTRIYRHHARQWYGAKDRTGRLQCAIFESAWSRTIPQAANWYLTISTDINRKMASNLPFPYSTTAHES